MWKSAKIYVPYILTCIMSAAMFYNIASFLSQPKLPGGDAFYMMMSFGTIVVGIFCIIFLFYTNSFLIKRRKNEFGLYNILGMEKRHIVGMITIETCVTAFIGTVGGLLVGILFNRLVFMLVKRFFVFYSTFTYAFSVSAVIMTVFLFGFIYFLILLKNILEVCKVKPIDLLKAEKSGEKEPKIKWIMAILGLVTLGYGYYLSVTCTTPIMAITRSIYAVLLVIFGTYFLFVAGSIAVLKLLRKNKGYYYKSSHFVSVAGMLYRMKQNAVGLANICILSTMVMVMISTTVSLFAGNEDVVKMRYPAEFSYKYYDVDRNFDGTKIEEMLRQKVADAGLEMLDYNTHTYTTFSAAITPEGKLLSSAEYNAGDFMSVVTLIEASQYYAFTGSKLPELAPGTIALSTKSGKNYDTLSFMGEDLPVTTIKNVNLTGELSVIANDTYLIVAPDEETYYYLIDLQHEETYRQGGTYAYPEVWFYFDTTGSAEEKEQLFYSITGEDLRTGMDEVNAGNVNIIPSLRSLERVEWYQFSASFLFLGIYLGILFVMATVLIIYYKQLIEGYEDKDKYEIMQKVGMDKHEVQKTIRHQVKTMFFLPLGVAICHTFGAFPMLNQCLRTLNLYNSPLYLISTLITILVYVVAYAVVYAVTTKVYYRIVTSRG